eukprot:Plantae.Rhodophyta-Purpureofilum_apyrenoidigerum.ctg7333.p2 GENE.Plantae.Rhodophyta-Purpureofilum_apyrenoidigerum.ctg7333~~Plantae.Rhodophyta-Purpureofilum_apyrenoidigerum.ctg7333.p2  ORF type:complete len:454 (-),score=116.85 Plantae.Rhodophyta-Purpureofilum_apyrenoidigerum.ctg7333:1773-3134(-)
MGLDYTAFSVLAGGPALKKRAVIRASTEPSYKYVVLGGGNAAGYVAKQFVELGGGKGELAIVGKETVAPYERPALSKAFLFADPPARLPGFHTSVGGGGERQSKEWYEQHGIDLLLGKEIEKADLKSKTLKAASGEEIKAENLILATGCGAVILSKLPGADLKNIFYLREHDGALELYDGLKAAKGKDVVVVGGGYIGMEVAAAASIMGCNVKMIFPDSFFMPRLFTPDIAAFYEKFYTDKKVEIIKHVKCTGFEGSGSVSGVVLEEKNGSKQTVSADAVIIGVGSRPNTSLFDGQVDFEMGGISVDSYMKTSVDGVYAIGDIATFPLKLNGNKKMRAEHVGHARQSAAQAVKALLNKSDGEYDYLPFFYSRVFNLSWQFFGQNEGDTVLVGNMDPKLACFWIKDGKVNGVFMESPSEQDTEKMKKIAKENAAVDVSKLKSASGVDEAMAFFA